MATAMDLVDTRTKFTSKKFEKEKPRRIICGAFLVLNVMTRRLKVRDD